MRVLKATANIAKNPIKNFPIKNFPTKKKKAVFNLVYFIITTYRKTHVGWE